MARDGAVYVCQSCGAAQSKWAGQCPACNAWNSLVEEVTSRAPGSLAPTKATKTRGLAFEGQDPGYELRPVLNIAVGGSGGKDARPGKYPCDMLVDFVRIFPG